MYWYVCFRARNGWDAYRQYVDYYSALRWSEYYRETRGWKVYSITRGNNPYWSKS